MASNPLPWPEIKQHTQRITHTVQCYLDSLQAAAIVIQRRWRERSARELLYRVGGGVSDGVALLSKRDHLRRFTRANVEQFFLRDDATATVKLDDTNFGIGTDGTLYGRRMVVDEGAKSYQSTDISELRGRGEQVTEVRRALAEIAGCEELLGAEFSLYGELCCNKLYDYGSTGDLKAWRIFGCAVKTAIEFADVIADKLTGVGFRVHCAERESGDKVTLVIGICDRLRGVIESVLPAGDAVRCVPEAARGSLVQIVAQMNDWMMESWKCGEGLVLCHAELGDNDNGRVVLGKWKGAQEPQDKNKRELASLRQRLSSQLKPAVGFLLPFGVEAMLDQMDAVANVVPPTKQEAKKKAAPKEKKVLVEGVEEAIASALTKFDSLQTFFAAGKRGEIAKLLQDEVTADLLGAEGAKGKEGKQKAKFVGAQVQRAVGTAFGVWKKSGEPVADAA